MNPQNPQNKYGCQSPKNGEEFFDPHDYETCLLSLGLI